MCQIDDGLRVAARIVMIRVIGRKQSLAKRVTESRIRIGHGAFHLIKHNLIQTFSKGELGSGKQPEHGHNKPL
jgi:hypothetical protein